jgi:soluble lytic murein transglycosylase
MEKIQKALPSRYRVQRAPQQTYIDHNYAQRARMCLTAIASMVIFSYLMVSAHAASLPDAPTSIPPISILSSSDAKLYEEIFALQRAGDIKTATKKVKALDNDLLMGHVLSQKYLHPTAWRSTYAELSSWLKKYNDHPAASRIKWLSNRRKPNAAKAARNPKPGYLNGVGLSQPQSFRATVPESWKGRSSPKQTAAIAREIRRFIRRGHPSGAADYLSKKSTLRYLTISEEAHLRGEIAHAYLIFGVDDKAIRAARQAIAKSGETAWMGYWAGGLAAWRSHRYELAGTFFRSLVDLEKAPDVLRAGAAFWAHRALMREGQPKRAMEYLEIASYYPHNFYGVVALQVAGQTKQIEFVQPSVSDSFLSWLRAQAGGKRALALLQSGNWTEAARELRYLHGEMPERFTTDMIGFAARYNMPGLAFRLADIYRQDTGVEYNAALYPVLDTDVEFSVDEALIWSIIRKESGFYPLARSHAKAAGLMQIMPATAAFIARDRQFRSSKRHLLHNPDVNLSLGQDYIAHLLDEKHIKGDLVRLLAAYNGGPGNLRKWLRSTNHQDDPLLLIESIPARETRNYIKGVISFLFMYRNRFDEEMPMLQGLVTGGATDNLVVRQ